MSRGLESSYSHTNLKSYTASAFPGIPVHASSAELLTPKEKEKEREKEQQKKKNTTKNLTLNPFKRTLRVKASNDKDSEPRYLQKAEDEEQEGPQIKFLPENPNKIQAISLAKIIELITPEFGPVDSSLRTTFFLTYHSLISSSLLLDKIILRYQSCGCSDITRDVLDYRSKQQIRIKVLGLLKYWMTQAEQDISKDETLLSSVVTFLQSIVQELPGPASSLLNIIQRNKKGEISRESTDWKIVKKVAPSTPKLRASTAADIADQLCLIEQGLFQKITVKELLIKQSKRTMESCPNILNMISHCNNISNWVRSLVEKRSTPKKKKKTFDRFLILSAKLRERNNFNGMDEVSVGLRRTSVGQQSADQLVIKDYTQLLQTSNLPLLPSLGAIELELKFVEDCFPKDMEDNLINWTKREKLREVLEPILLYQKQSYRFQELPDIKKWLASVGNSSSPS